MKGYFLASLCREGILGGAILADDAGITFRTNKLTVPPRLKNLRLDYRDIQSFSKKWVLCFPVFTLRLREGEVFRFIVFAPRRFSALLGEQIHM